MKERILTRNFCFSFLSMFSIAMVMYMLMGTITDYVSNFGTNAAIAGFVSGVYVVGGMFSRLYSGHGLDKFGWKRLANIFSVIHFGACCFYPFISSLPLLIIVRFIHGIGFGAASSAIATIGMSVLPQSRFGEAAGYLMMATTISVGLGPFLGGYVYDSLGNSACFVLAIIMSFLSLFFILFVNLTGIDPGASKSEKKKGSDTSADTVENASADANTNADTVENAAADAEKSPVQVPEAEQLKGIYKVLEPRVIAISMITSLSAFGYVSVMSFYRLFAKMTDLEQEFSYFFLLYAALLVFFRPFAGKIQDRYGNAPVCITGVVCQTAGLILLALKPCVLTMVICAIGCAAGFGTLNSACNVMACQKVSIERRSYAVSTYYLLCDLGMGVGPALLGIVASVGSYYVMYVVAAVLTLIGLPVFFIVNRQEKTS